MGSSKKQARGKAAKKSPKTTGKSQDPEQKKAAGRICRKLLAEYPDAECALHFDSPFELLIATILSAQCTDERVNQTTPALFEAYPDAASMADAERDDLEALIRPTGFFRNKAKSLQGCAGALVERHDGEVPESMEELVELPGVGRKTANVVRGSAFELPAVFVDTHVKRLSGRLGLTTQSDPNKIEEDIRALLPKSKWTHFCHALIWHGRQVCKARKPMCEGCALLQDCPTGRDNLLGD